jgi:metal-sulfur cluster biosynthetic enzyme
MADSPTPEIVYQHLSQVIDPELHIDIVSLGLIYDVTVAEVQTVDGPQAKIHILMTLTTPGCPLAGVFDQMVKESLIGLEDDNGDPIDPDHQVEVELTFDPPWLPEMMTEEARAELGL